MRGRYGGRCEVCLGGGLSEASALLASEAAGVLLEVGGLVYGVGMGFVERLGAKDVAIEVKVEIL